LAEAILLRKQVTVFLQFTYRILLHVSLVWLAKESQNRGADKPSFAMISSQKTTLKL
jgi:hypothetical protein